MFTGLFHDDFLSVSAVSFFCVSEFFARVFMSGNHSYFFFTCVCRHCSPPRHTPDMLGCSPVKNQMLLPSQ